MVTEEGQIAVAQECGGVPLAFLLKQSEGTVFIHSVNKYEVGTGHGDSCL